MVRIVFADHLLPVTAGEREIALPVTSVRELLQALERRFPGSEPFLKKCAIAINGEIHQDAFLEPLDADSDVFFMQRIEGG